MVKDDVVLHPKHYTVGNIECLTYLEDSLDDGFSYFLEGNVKKYLHRFRYKHTNINDQLNDLKKAQFYLNKLIDVMSK
tara:strand:+ start:25 stop:258 length:234 start_codon:yes stop_codon:yes gene_type:complete